ncbi:MAG: S9 family peptidase, partial [Caulobacteraceae bacterium]|nr:S9 family peptidase [Caulobacter sp.]
MPRLRPALLAASALLALAAAPAHAQPRGLTAQDLVSLDRVGDPHVSPDGRTVVYDLRATDLQANKGVHSLWLVGVGGGGAPVMQPGSQGATSPRWGRDGKLYYLKDGQVWRATPGGADALQVTALPLDVDTFRLSPDGTRIVVSMAVFPDAEDPAATKAREDARKADKSSGRIYDKLFVRHWDTWADGTRNHLFSVRLGADGRAAG